MRAAVLAAVVLVSAGLLAGCGSTHSAAPLHCLKAAGLSSAKANSSTNWQAIPPGVQGANLFFSKVSINKYPTASQAHDAAMMAQSVYTLATGRYAVSVGMPRDRHFVRAVASCLRGATPSVQTPNVGVLQPSSMERHWFGRVGSNPSAPAATGVRADRRTELIRRAVQKPGVQILSLRVYSTPAIAPSLSPALVLAVARPAYSLRHQLKQVLALLTENRSAYYLRVVDARAKRVLESYWSPVRGAAVHAEGSIYLRPALLGCSPIMIVGGIGRVPPCPSK